MNIHIRQNHGMSRTKAYQVWEDMMRRCYNTKSKAYRHYGGRGIAVCYRWKKFRNFFIDMGQPPIGYTLERIDNSHGYSPANCRWATRKQQSQNTRRNRFVEALGQRRTLSAWAEHSGVKRATIESRLNRGVHPDDAVRPTQKK